MNNLFVMLFFIISFQQASFAKEITKKVLDDVLSIGDKLEAPNKKDQFCVIEPKTGNKITIYKKEAWGGEDVRKDNSFPCMDYYTMAPLMGISTNQSEEDFLNEVYEGGRIIVHHTVLDYTIQEVQKFHFEDRGLQDIAYHYYISKNGNINEGRPLSLMGANAGNLGKSKGKSEASNWWCGEHKGEYVRFAKQNRDYDYKGIGVAVEGNLELDQPTEAQVKSLRQLLSYLMERFKIKNINGHQHYRRGATDCPGANLMTVMKQEKIQLEPPIDKSRNFMGPEFICPYVSGYCKK